LRQKEVRSKGCVISVHDVDRGQALGDLDRFRQEFYGCLAARADGLFELADAVLCTEGRGHGGLYDAINNGRIAANTTKQWSTGPPSYS
jgi:hypothetical protein